MAPTVPEEVDVFSIPHSRMKGLVNEYFEMLRSTNFTNDMDMDVLLQSLLKTFMEFKTHEQIENRYIMKKLKTKLKKLSIQNSAVCNCHKDDQLGQMMQLIKAGYKKKTEQDRMNYAVQLQAQLEDFTETFLPHMQEEEEVFQPLLLKYFSYEELCDLKQKVIQQHLIQEQIRSLGLEKYVVEDARDFTTSCSSEDEEKAEKLAGTTQSQEVVEEPQTSISSIPPELMTRILSFLSVKDLLRCSQVCVDWNDLALQPTLWHNILPVQWAQGDWRFKHEQVDEDDGDEQTDEEEEYIVVDDDADVDESEGCSDRLEQMKMEARVVMGVAKHLLPRVGEGVRRLSLANSKAVTNGLLNRMLQKCPNIEYLDLTQTRIGDAGLKCLGKNRFGQCLKNLTLSGCVNISDATMVRLAMALNSNRQQPPAAESSSCVPDNSKQAASSSSSCCVPDNNHTHEASECLCEQYYDQYSVVLAGGCQVVESWNNKKCGDYHERRHKAGHKAEVDDEEKDGGDEKSHGMKNKKAVEKNGTCSNCDCSKDNSATAENSWVKGSDVRAKNSSHHSSVNDRTGQHESCHSFCSEPNSKLVSWNSIEDCASSDSHGGDKNRTNLKLRPNRNWTLQHLDLSGCFQITDLGIRALSNSGHFPGLQHLDLSGCFKLTGPSMIELVGVCMNLQPDQLYYCDNILDGPWQDSASGCQNTCCGRRFCCRSGE